MRRDKLFRSAALLSLVTLLMAITVMNVLHPWLHAHDTGAQSAPSLRASGSHAHRGECPACKFLASFHAAAHDLTSRMAATAALTALPPLPTSTPAQSIPCLPLGARAPPF